MGSRAERAAEFFLQGANCSQAVLAAFHADVGMDLESALKLASPFGGGMGRMREVCGALTSVCMIAGSLYGYSDLEDADKKAAHYKLIQEFAREFKEKNGSIICRDLLGLEESDGSWVPGERTQSYYDSRPCLEIVKNAAEIMENYMKQEELKKGTQK